MLSFLSHQHIKSLFLLMNRVPIKLKANRKCLNKFDPTRNRIGAWGLSSPYPRRRGYKAVFGRAAALSFERRNAKQASQSPARSLKSNLAIPLRSPRYICHSHIDSLVHAPNPFFLPISLPN